MRFPRVLFINQHYAPDFAATGQYLTDLAEHLAADGYEVHVLTASSHYTSGAIEAPATEVLNGVHVRRVQTTAFGRGSNVGRVLDYASFYGQVLFRLLFQRRYDLVVVLTTPPLLSVSSALARVVRGQRYGIWSMDLHPEAEEAHGMLKPGSLGARVLHGLSGFGYRHADFVVSLGRCMSERLRARYVAAEKLAAIPVWSRADEVAPVPKAENPLADELGLRERFVVMYSGNAGVAHRFEEVLGAMDRLRDQPGLFFLFVGGGPRRSAIEAHIEDQRLENATYLDYFPREQIGYSLPLADVHLITLRSEMSGIAVPSKLFGAMATARPIVMVGPRSSEVARIIEESACGYVIDPDTESDPTAALVRILRQLQDDPALAQRLGEAGREAFLTTYVMERALDRWDAVLATWVGRPSATDGLPRTEPSLPPVASVGE